jgi:hypothetical protein
MSEEQYISDESKQQMAEGAVAVGQESLEIGKQSVSDAAASAKEAAEAAAACAASGFVPINPIDWVISYIPNMALAVGIIIAVILMFICLGFLFSGEYGTAASLFIAAASVALVGYGVATALTWVPLIGGKYACRKGAGSTVTNTLNRAWNFGTSVGNMPVIWPVTYPLSLILKFNLAYMYLLWLPISF